MDNGEILVTTRFAIVIRLLFLTLTLSVCLGAADFPNVDLDEVTEALVDEEFFEEISEFDIPRVAEREYGEDLKRLPVERVVVTGVVPFPDAGITQESIQRLMDVEFESQQGIELDENGFTPRDLLDIGRFLRDLRDRGDNPDLEDLGALNRLLTRQEVERGWLTIEQLDAIALAVTRHYRENGYILATAFIPEQEVADGVVKISLLEGRLGDVQVSNNEIFSDETIVAAFRPELGAPVTEARIESAIRRINDLPGVRVRGSFSPGQNVGETSLNLGVEEEQSWAASVLMDNHGSETTGELRAFARGSWLNVGGRGHQLVIGILQSEGPDSSTFGVAEYEMPVTKDGRLRVKASISSNQFAVNLPSLPEIVGETNNFSISGNYKFIKSRTLNLSAQVGYTQKEVRFEVGELVTLSTDQQIETYSIAGDYTRLWDEQLLLVTGHLGVDIGHMIDGEVVNQSANFEKVLFTVNLLKRFSIPNWFRKHDSFFNFVFKLNGQYSEKFLSAVEQFALGGPSAVRAFGVSDVSVDSGAYAGFELFFDAPIDPTQIFDTPLDPIKPFLFFDYAYGVARTPGNRLNRDAIIKAYGFGMRLNWPGKGTANLILAKPSSASFQDGYLDVTGRSRIYLDIVYQIQ